MQLRELKRIAEKEVGRYRESAAFVRGYLDGGGTGESARYEERQRWVWAIDRVREQLAAAHPEKAAFFERLYRFDAPHGKRITKETMIKLSMELYTAPSTLYKWREEILLSIAIAAVQSKAIRPY